MGLLENRINERREGRERRKQEEMLHIKQQKEMEFNEDINNIKELKSRLIQEDITMTEYLCFQINKKLDVINEKQNDLKEAIDSVSSAVWTMKS
ncbi:MAG: hypothetical protein SOI56_10115 [Eubacteriales bacterium]|jgi:hypothetical protein